MNEFSGALVCLCAGVGVTGLMVAAAFVLITMTRKGSAKTVEAWQQAGEATGLDFKKTGLGSPVLSGSYQGRAVRAYIARGTSKTPTRTAYISSHDNTVFPMLRVNRQVKGAIMGPKGIAIGVPEFDEAFLIMCEDRDRAIDLLEDPTLRERLMAIERVHLSVEGGQVHLSEMGDVTDPARIQARLKLLLEIVNRVDSL